MWYRNLVNLKILYVLNAMNVVKLNFLILVYALFGCSKNHATFLKPKEFYNSQNINITNIICENVKLKIKQILPIMNFIDA